jgi:hypothetical protein
MTLHKLTRGVYLLLGVMYVAVGIGAMLLPTGWIPFAWAGQLAPLYEAELPDSYLNHQTQEFGTLAIAVGLVFSWQALRAEPSRGLHWLLTLYLTLDSLIHWIGPQGIIGSFQRGLINSIPPFLFLALGLLAENARNKRRLGAG